jgi:hypothetical protein
MSILNSSTNKSVSKGKISVLKTDKFFGTDELCVIGKLIEGGVCENMSFCGDSNKKVVSVESKSGDRLCTKIGAQVVLMVSGIEKEEVLVGEELQFEKTLFDKPRPVGRFIIA